MKTPLTAGFMKLAPYAFAAAVTVFLMSFGGQGDYVHTVKSLDALWNGELLSFYSQNSKALGGNDYLITIYLIYAVLLYPFQFLNELGHPLLSGLQINLLLVKIVNLTAIVTSGWAIQRLVTRINSRNSQSGIRHAIVICSSPFLVYPALLWGQYDVIAVALGLLGVYSLFKGKIFLAGTLLGLAITIKYFAIVLFILLGLLVVRGLLPKIKFFAAGVLPLLAAFLPFAGDPAFANRIGALPSSRIAKIIEHPLVPLGFILAIFVILLLILESRRLEPEGRYGVALIASGMLLADLFILASWHPQWFAYSAVFIGAGISLGRRKPNFVILLVAEIGLFAAMIYVSSFEWWLFGSDNWNAAPVRAFPPPSWVLADILPGSRSELPYLIFGSAVLLFCVAVAITSILPESSRGSSLEKARHLVVGARLTSPLIVLVLVLATSTVPWSGVLPSRAQAFAGGAAVPSDFEVSALAQVSLEDEPKSFRIGNSQAIGFQSFVIETNLSAKQIEKGIFRSTSGDVFELLAVFQVRDERWLLVLATTCNSSLVASFPTTERAQILADSNGYLRADLIDSAKK